jgi:hypothetical protein
MLFGRSSDSDEDYWPPITEQTETPPDGHSEWPNYEIVPDMAEEGVYHLHEADDPDAPSIWSRLFG